MKKITSVALKNIISKTLKNHKAIDIVALDIKELSDMADYMVICTANSPTHTKTLVEKLRRQLALAQIKPIGIEGENTCEWMLADFGDVIAHIMLEPIREFYSLEKLWRLNPASKQNK